MGHHYISLGSACNAATMMKHAGLRRASYPFDWLLNVRDGLSAVTKIIEDDFQSVTTEGCYQVVYHEPVGRDVPAYKRYRETFHVHSDPASDPKLHEEMVRRFNRLREVLHSADFLHFVYYRDFSECKRANPTMSATAAFDFMRNEADQFLSTIDRIRKGKTSILVVLEGSVEDSIEVSAAAKLVRSPDKRIAFGGTLARYDDNKKLLEEWQMGWIDLIVNQTNMPVWLNVKCHTKRTIRSLRQTLRSKVSHR